MRTCSQCGETKSVEEFSRDRRSRDGRRASCRACQSVRNREQYQANRDKRLEYRRAHHEANRDKLIAGMRVYDEANRGAKLARGRAYREAHRQQAAERTRAWRAANPDKCRGHKHTKRARKLAAPYEAIDPSTVYLRDGGVCGICGESTDPADWHLDHIVPLSRGGHHTYDNVQVAHPFCNMSKGAQLPPEAVA